MKTVRGLTDDLQAADGRSPGADVPVPGVIWVDSDQMAALLPAPQRPPEPGGLAGLAGRSGRSGRSARRLEWTWLLVRFGTAAVLLTNAVYAFAQPDDFAQILRGNPITGWLPDDIERAAVMLAGINDAVLGICVLARRWRPRVWAWLGAWFAVIAATKLLNLLF